MLHIFEQPVETHLAEIDVVAVNTIAVGPYRTCSVFVSLGVVDSTSFFSATVSGSDEESAAYLSYFFLFCCADIF